MHGDEDEVFVDSPHYMAGTTTATRQDNTMAAPQTVEHWSEMSGVEARALEEVTDCEEWLELYDPEKLDFFLERQYGVDEAAAARVIAKKCLAYFAKQMIEKVAFAGAS